MADDLKQKRKVFLLVVMLIIDTTTSMPTPPPSIAMLGTVPSTQHDDQTSTDVASISDFEQYNLQVVATHPDGFTENSQSSRMKELENDITIYFTEKNSLLSDIKHLLLAVNYSNPEEEINPGSQTNQDDHDEEHSEMVDHVIDLREEMMTTEVEMKTLEIMQDIGRYNDKVSILGDLNDTIGSMCDDNVSSAVEEVLVNLGEDQDVVTVLTMVALLQLHQCLSAAINIPRRLSAAVDDQKYEDLRNLSSQTTDEFETNLPANESEWSTGSKQPDSGDALPVANAGNYCDFVDECKQTGIPVVRAELARHPSLLALYDVAAAAVFTPGNGEALANALLGDVINDLNITTSDAGSDADFNGTKQPLISKRSSCVDKHEAKAQSVISWIPFVGTVYDLVSSAVYAAKGCKDVAKERALEGTVNVALDAGTVLTAGAGAAAFQGAKAAVKGATKQVVKQVAKKAFKKTAGSLAKHTVNGYANPIKGAIIEAKAAASGVAGLAKNVHKIAKKGGQSIKKGVQKLTKSGMKQVDEASQNPIQKGWKGSFDVDSSGISSKASKDKALQRCARGTGLTCTRLSQKTKKIKKDKKTTTEKNIKINTNKVTTAEKKLLKDTDTKYTKGTSTDLQNKHPGRWNELRKNEIKDKDLLPPRGKNAPKLVGIDLTKSNLENKKLFQTLQEKAAENAPLYVKQNLGGIDTAYVVRRQPWKNSKDQVVIKVLKPAESGVQETRLANYKEITKKLDTFTDKKELASKMLEAINNPPNSVTGLKELLKKDRSMQTAAKEFIVLTQLAEAVPGRIKGNDAFFRAGLKQIAEGKRTFSKFYTKAGLVMKPKTLGPGKKFVKGTDEAERMAALEKTGSDPNAVHDIIKDMSVSERRRRK